MTVICVYKCRGCQNRACKLQIEWDDEISSIVRETNLCMSRQAWHLIETREMNDDAE